MDVKTIKNNGNRFSQHAVIIDSPKPQRFKLAVDLSSRNKLRQIENTGQAFSSKQAFLNDEQQTDRTDQTAKHDVETGVMSQASLQSEEIFHDIPEFLGTTQR